LAKKEFKMARNFCLRNKTYKNRIQFTKIRTIYNLIQKKAKPNFRINEAKRLEEIAKTQPRTFWKSIKNATKVKTAVK
jgi:hypothetical protein